MDSFAQIVDVLEKEKKRILQMQKQYQEEFAELPQGSLYITRRDSKQYLSSVYQVKGKRVNRYIGNISEDKTLESVMRGKVDRRKHLSKELGNLEKDLEAIDRMLKIAGKRIQQTLTFEPSEKEPSDPISPREAIKGFHDTAEPLTSTEGRISDNVKNTPDFQKPPM